MPRKRTIDYYKEKEQAAKLQIKRLQGAEQKKKRALDTHRKVLAGSAILHGATMHEDVALILNRELDRFLTKDAHRAVFNLQPLPGKERE